MSDNRYFYRDLVPLPSFETALDPALHIDLPDDWWIVIADVSDSTEAIAWGAYKNVNTVGVACIAAMANIDRSIELPYLFGGDGATFAIPEALCKQAVVALRGTQRMAMTQFGLHLRAGLVKVGDLKNAENRVLLGKVNLSADVHQPVFSGRGWEAAERRIKRSQVDGVLHVRPNDGDAEANFEGFECRWQNVPSFQDHKLSLIVVATATDSQLNQATYRQTLDRVREIFGDVDQHHPLRAEQMRLSFSPRMLSYEWRVRSNRLGFWGRSNYFLRILLQNTVGRFLFARNIDTPAVRWSRYRNDLVDNTDFRKFDGALRMLVDASEQQAALLTEWLEARYAAGCLVYGISKSRQALITCLVESHAGRHVHFVDGSDGGYALAAQQLKEQLKLREN